MIKILVISNLYPPYQIGGYELGCMEVVEGLRGKGYDVKVLTSTYRYNGDIPEAGVIRALKAYFRWEKRGGLSNEAGTSLYLEHNRIVLKNVLKEISPHIVYIWNFHGLHPSLLFDLQGLNIPIAYYVSDYWPTKPLYNPYAGVSGITKLWRNVFDAVGIARMDKIDMKYAQFVSKYVKQRILNSGLHCEKGVVIHWGVNAGMFRFRARPGRHIRLLYVGQVVPHKGIVTAIEAFRQIRMQAGIEDARLRIIGGTVCSEHAKSLAEMIERYGLMKNVSLEGEFRREQLPEIYAENDILLFPSIWEEPFSITILEAMASGVAVVATDTGGTPEILADGVNAMLFPKEDANCCARKTIELIQNVDLYQKVVREARQCIEKGFMMTSMLDKIEQHLLEVAEVRIACCDVV